MTESFIARPPRRITDLIEAKRRGADLRLAVDFEILPVDFHHRTYPFKAYIFLAKYRGTMDGGDFAFRKCYARGCPSNLCTHVSQAVTIANRYLQRDYHSLASVGIPAGDTLFTLTDMLVKFEHIQAEGRKDVTIPELIEFASGSSIEVGVELELIPAVAHFVAEEKAQTYLNSEFTAIAEKRHYYSHRCLACFDPEQEEIEKPPAVAVANNRLAAIYHDFDRHGIACQVKYFS